MGEHPNEDNAKCVGKGTHFNQQMIKLLKKTPIFIHSGKPVNMNKIDGMTMALKRAGTRKNKQSLWEPPFLHSCY